MFFYICNAVVHSGIKNHEIWTFFDFSYFFPPSTPCLLQLCVLVFSKKSHPPCLFQPPCLLMTTLQLLHTLHVYSNLLVTRFTFCVSQLTSINKGGIFWEKLVHSCSKEEWRVEKIIEINKREGLYVMCVDFFSNL